MARKVLLCAREDCREPDTLSTMTRSEAPSVTNLVRGMLSLRGLRGRELAIVGSAWLEAAVEVNLRYNMLHSAGVEPERQVFARALRGLESRLLIAQAFGLFGHHEVGRQADLVRRVRNEFAHTFEDVTCDSPTIAPIIDEMSLTTRSVMDGLRVRKSGDGWLDSSEFTFDGEVFGGAAVQAIIDVNPYRVLFFVPDGGAFKNRDDRLRQQIHASVFGVLGTGLRPWLEETVPEGIAEIVVRQG